MIPKRKEKYTIKKEQRSKKKGKREIARIVKEMKGETKETKKNETSLP